MTSSTLEVSANRSEFPQSKPTVAGPKTSRPNTTKSSSTLRKIERTSVRLLITLVLSGINYTVHAQDQTETAGKTPEKVNYNNNAVIKINRGNYAGALEDLDKALAIDPQYRKALQNRSLAKAASGDIFGATNDLYIETQTGHPHYEEKLSYRDYLSRFVDDYLAAYRRAEAIHNSIKQKQISPAK